jgi:pyridoxamine 5'-phosphate oxidase
MDINQTLENLRVSYRLESLDIADCRPDPLAQFDYWLKEAINGQCDEPNAFTLSTVIHNKPRGRVLLLKGLYEGKFVFYTNYASAKGHEMDLNPHVAMTFLWLPLQRQVRIEGTVTKVETSFSDDYFSKRPRGSQLGAISSPQSQKVSSRQVLEKMFADTQLKFGESEPLKRPETWGGYALNPEYMEFWQGRDNRMHDRIAYEKENGVWTLSRLAP